MESAEKGKVRAETSGRVKGELEKPVSSSGEAV